MSESPTSRPREVEAGHAPAQSSSANTSVNGDAMDTTPTAAGTMGPPMPTSPELDPHTLSNGLQHDQLPGAGGMSAVAATSSQQPKVVQTAFIHKLYSMLEDSSIQNLISWSNNNESFIMSPTADFAKVLAQYFKHTNISSFVRQLNMYGFHKVSDVFHTGAPDSTLWEFKHGNGSFKRGDLAGLREIKRRASRHALIHRESFTAPSHHHKPSMSQPGTPAEAMMDPAEARLVHMEHSLYDMHARLIRMEESNSALSSKCAFLSDSMGKAHQWNLDLTHMVSAMIPDSEHPIKKDAQTLERDVVRHLDTVRNYEDPHESLLSGRQPYFSNMALADPVSPRQGSIDDRRPSSLAASSRPSSMRSQPPPVHHAITPPQRRYGSIGTAHPAPNYHRAFPPQTQIAAAQPSHPLATVAEPGPNMGRRHTSADIRVLGWPGHTQASPFASAESSGNWPSSPIQPGHPHDHHQVREQLASYEFGRPRNSISSQQTTSPLASNDTTPSTLSVESVWSWGAGANPAGGGSKFGPRGGGGIAAQDSAPNTRRSSMASNVHSLLNPAETAEREEEDGDSGSMDDRKRKRL